MLVHEPPRHRPAHRRSGASRCRSSFALIVLKTSAGQRTFQRSARSITRLLDFAVAGSSFVFGPLGDKAVWAQIMTNVLGAEGARYGVVFAFQVLPTIIFIAALFAILYYFGVMQLDRAALRDR